MFKEILVKKIFDLEKGKSKYTRRYILDNSGKYPVFSSQTTKEGTIGYINSYDYGGECLTWTTDGIHAGTVFYRNGKFSMTTHCGALFLKKEIKDIDLKYIAYALSLILKDYAIGEGNKRVTKDIIANVNFKIPIKKNGSYDLEKQKEIASKLLVIKKIKSFLEKEYEEFNKRDFEIETDKKLKEVKIGNEDLFILDNGERIRKEDIDRAKGDIPVYSASKFKNESLGLVSDRIKDIVPNAKKFNGKFITINADGSVGKVFLRNEEFYANDILNVVKIKEKDILEEYVLYELQNRLYSLGFSSWSNKLYKEKLRGISIFIPVDKDGKFDIDEQKRLAKKYHNIEKMKELIVGELNSIVKTKVDLVS